jgi:hypothetical protein
MWRQSVEDGVFRSNAEAIGIGERFVKLILLVILIMPKTVDGTLDCKAARMRASGLLHRRMVCIKHERILGWHPCVIEDKSIIRFIRMR